MKIILRIDRLVLSGLSLNPAQRERMQRALETELERLFGQSAEDRLAGTLQGLSQGSLVAPTIPYSGNPEEAGRQIARSLYQSITHLAIPTFSTSGTGPD